jgi:hypothetical protein
VRIDENVVTFEILQTQQRRRRGQPRTPRVSKQGREGVTHSVKDVEAVQVSESFEDLLREPADLSFLKLAVLAENGAEGA